MKINSLIKGIKILEEREATGELAYHCLNGKSENHFRDLIAFNIARNNPSWLIVREKDRIDLKLQNTKGYELNIEFKIGYAAVVINKGQNSKVISSSLKDIEKRNINIVNCIGLMDFKGSIENNLGGCRNPSIIKRTLSDIGTLRKCKNIIKKIWPNSKCRFTTVRCGKWANIEVKIMFATIQHA